MRRFRVHHKEQGLVHLAELNEAGDVIGVPVGLPIGTRLQDESGLSWFVLRRVGAFLALNRPWSEVGMQFHL